MPWTAADAKSHTKKADTPAKQKKWAKIANDALKEYDGDEGKAIAVANAAMDRNDDDDDGYRSLGRWRPWLIETRLASLGPGSYDKKARTVDAVLSVGSPVKRFYGTEVLRIDQESIDLSRLRQGSVPVLDSHNQQGISAALGRVKQAWISQGALMGKLSFHQTPEGRKAEGMVARGEITGISAGYRIEEWEITDDQGRVLDPEIDRIRWDDDLTFTATRWELLEASLVAVPADASAGIRSYYGDRALTFPSIFQSRNADIRMRMSIRQAMYRRASRAA